MLFFLGLGGRLKKKTNIFTCIQGMDTDLHVACRWNDEETIHYLISHDEDVLSVNRFGKTPIELIDQEKENYFDCVEPIIAEIARLTSENKRIPQKIMSIIETNDYLVEVFQESRCEIERMKKTIFYENYSYYTILKMSKKKKKIAFLLNRDAFEKNFSRVWEFKFNFFERKLWVIFYKACELNNELKIVHAHLKLIFGEFLPDVVLRNLANFLSIADLTD